MTYEHLQQIIAHVGRSSQRGRPSPLYSVVLKRTEEEPRQKLCETCQCPAITYRSVRFQMGTSRRIGSHPTNTATATFNVTAASGDEFWDRGSAGRETSSFRLTCPRRLAATIIVEA